MVRWEATLASITSSWLGVSLMAVIWLQQFEKEAQQLVLVWSSNFFPSFREISNMQQVAPCRGCQATLQKMKVGGQGTMQ